MERGALDPSSTGEPPVDPNPAPSRWTEPGSRRLPGLTDSAPLLIFGAAALGFGIYLLLSHTSSFGGRFPLWAYLTMLGSIALVGGLFGASVGEGFEGLPREGDTLGDDLIVVSRQEWYSLHGPPAVEAAPAQRPEPVLRRSKSDGSAVPPAPPRRGSQPSVAATVGPAVGDRASPPDWWEEALHPTPPAPPTPVTIAQPRPDLEDVLRTLDSIAAEATTAPPAQPSAGISAPTPPAPGRGVAPTPAPVEGRPSATPALRAKTTPALIDRQIEEIARGLDELLVTPPPKVAVPIGPTVECVGCRLPVPGTSPRTPCESCNRPMCAGCLENSSVSGHPGLCPVCAMLLDGSTAPG